MGRPWQAARMEPTNEPIPLDLASFQDRDKALELAAYGCPKLYTDVAAKHLMDRKVLTVGSMLFESFVSRMRGLHEGAIREIAANNPHAALPLQRAWIEITTIALYILRKPDYVDLVAHGPGEGRPARKSFASMFHAVQADAPGLARVYAQLSDYTHFGKLGVWNIHTPDADDPRRVSWTDAPRWRDDEHFQAACAQAHELAVGSLDVLDRLGELLISDHEETEVAHAKPV